MATGLTPWIPGPSRKWEWQAMRCTAGTCRAVGWADQEQVVRRTGATPSGWIADHRAVAPLVSALKDESADVREKAAFALQQIGDSEATDALLPALHDEDRHVRYNALSALAEMRAARALDTRANPPTEHDHA